MAQQLSPSGPTPEASTKSTVGMKRLDQIAAIVLFVLSAYIVVAALQMPQWVEFAPGFGFFPFWLALLMAVLSVMLWVDATRRPAAQDEPNPFPRGKALLAVLGAMAVMVAYGVLLEMLGYILTTLLAVAFLMGVVQRDSLKTTVLTTVIVTAALFLIFQVLLGIRLPVGFLGF